METSEVALKLAGLVLQTKQADIRSDLIKIGIPSLVALVGAISTIIIGLKSHQKDLTIAKLNLEKESSKERTKLKVELIREISNDIAAIHVAAIEYASHYASKIELLAEGRPFPEMGKLRDKYEVMIKKMQENYKTDTAVLLLGEIEIIQTFRELSSSVTKFCSKYNPISNYADCGSLHQDTYTINQKKEVLYQQLSGLYFGRGLSGR